MTHDEVRYKLLTYERQIRDYERKLETRQKAMETWQDLFGRSIKSVTVSPKEARIHRQLDEWGAAWESLPKDVQWEHEIRRLAALLPINPAQALREIAYLNLQDNPLPNLVPLSSSSKPTFKPKPAPSKEQQLAAKVHFLTAIHQRVKNPDRSRPIPPHWQQIIKAHFKSQDQFQRQVCIEREPIGCVAIFEFHCHYCGKNHDLPVTLPELVAGFTEWSWRCTVNGSDHWGCFELVGIPDEVRALLP